MYSSFSKLTSPRQVDKDAITKDFEDNFIIGRQLGQGSFATVFEVTEKQTNKTYAAKVIDKKKHSIHMSLIAEEVKILRLLRGSPRVVNLIETYENSSKFIMLLELVSGGELFDKIVTKGVYSESDAMHLIRQILEGIAYCHARGIVHRDLKPENLLCETSDPDDLSDVKITDFGIAQVLKPGQTLTGRYGSPLYMAPEIVEGREYGSKVDMWSLGVISFILLGGYPPFAEIEDRPSLEDQITFGSYSFDQDSWQDVTDRAKDFVSKLLVTDPERRLSADQALMHPAFSASVRGSVMNRTGVLDKIKRYNARRRFRGAAFAIMSSNKMSRYFHMAQKIKAGIIQAKSSGQLATSTSSDSLTMSLKIPVTFGTSRSLRLFPRTGRSLITEKRIDVEVSSEGIVIIKDLPSQVTPSSLHIHSLSDPSVVCTSLSLDRKKGVASVKLAPSELNGKSSDFQVFYDTKSISGVISYHSVLSADQTTISTSGCYVISNDSGISMKFDSIQVLYGGEDHELKLSAPVVIADGESVSKNFLPSTTYNVSALTSPDVAAKIALDNGLILTMLPQETKGKTPLSKLPSGNICVYQSYKNTKRRPQLQLLSAGTFANVAEEKVERRLSKQTSSKAIVGITARRESSKKLVKAHSVKSVRHKQALDTSSSREEPAPVRLPVPIPAEKSESSPSSKKKDKEKKKK